jgi:hypothetical protein
MSKDVESYVVIDARAGKVFAPSPPFTMLGAMALDLPSDLWKDFLCFVENAKKQEREGFGELRYRFMRAALLSLFAHLNAMFDLLIASSKTDVDFQAYRQQEAQKRSRLPDWPKCEHGKYFTLYTEYVMTRYGKDMPKVDWSIKPLRNILAHPAGVRDVTVADLYNLDVDSLLGGAQSFHTWINEACQLCGVAYELDTEGVLKKFISSLAGQDWATQRF